MTNVPVAHRSEHDSIDEAARELAEEGEIPLAA
jgi:predicted transcriptional regulator